MFTMELIEKGTQFVVYFIKPIKEFMERRNQVNYHRKEKEKQSLLHLSQLLQFHRCPKNVMSFWLVQPLSHKDKWKSSF